MNESAAAKAQLGDREQETTARNALTIDHQAERMSGIGQSAKTNLDAHDVRSIVEQRFSRMNQAHDRIRSEELALRLAANEIK